jgi:hypothetical protein
VTRKNLFDDVSKHVLHQTNKTSSSCDNLDAIKEWYMSNFGAEEEGSQQESGQAPVSTNKAEKNENDGTDESDEDDVEGIFTHPGTNVHPAEQMKFFFMNYRVNSCSRAIKSIMRRLVTVSLK